MVPPKYSATASSPLFGWNHPLAVVQAGNDIWDIGSWLLKTGMKQIEF